MNNRTDTEVAFATMIAQNERLVYKVCSVYAAQVEDQRDLFQEIVLQAWSAYGRFTQQAKISTWLYRIALNTAISYRRKQKRTINVTVHDELLHHIADNMVVTHHEEYKVLYRLIGSLPALEKALILLYLDDNSYQEIADILGLTPTNVGVKLNRLKDKLRKQAQPLFK